MKKALLLIVMTFFLSNILTYAQTSEGIYSIHNFKDNGWESYQVFTITLDKKNGKLNAKRRFRDGKPRETVFKEVEVVNGEKIIFKDEFTLDGQVHLMFLTLRSEDNWETLVGDISQIKPKERLGFIKSEGEFSSGDNVIKMYLDKSGSKEVATKSTGLDEYVFAIHPLMIFASEEGIKNVEQLVREGDLFLTVCFSDREHKETVAKILSKHGFKPRRSNLYEMNLKGFLSDKCGFVFFTSKADAEYSTLLESTINGMAYGFIETGVYKQAEKQRIAKKKAEQEKQKRKQAEKQRIAAEKQRIAKKKAEQEKQKRNLKREKSGLGYKDIKFGMSIYDIERGGFCDKVLWDYSVNHIYLGGGCYKVAGKKRSMKFTFTKPNEQNASMSDETVYFRKSKLIKLDIYFGDYDPSFWKLLKDSLGKKYKFEYELSSLQQAKNDYNKKMFFDEGRIALYQFDKKGMYIQYSKDPIDDYAKFQPNTVKKIDSSDL